MSAQPHILVIRFSAMGDVAMTVPVIQQCLQQHPQLRITVVSNAFLQPLFDPLERCHFHPADLKGRHKGIGGMYRLYRELNRFQKFDAVVDLHDVLRSKMLRKYFEWKGIPIGVMNKGRAEKKSLTRKENKILQPLTSMHERYADVFRESGFSIQLLHQQVFSKATVLPELEPKIPSGLWIGVAPFAQYREKMYPLEAMKTVVKAIARTDRPVLLFGGKGQEASTLQEWANEIPNVFNLAGRLSFSDELKLISRLQCMISMDSANMHLASLYNVPVMSIWGATHPFAGFNGWNQSPQQWIQSDLSCRPCSVFGNKPCFRGDWACMESISPLTIIDKIESWFEANQTA